MADDALSNNGANGNAGLDEAAELDAINRMIASDEAAEAARGRNDKGQFTSADKDARRAGDRKTPEVISAKARLPDGSGAGDDDATPADGQKSASDDPAPPAKAGAETDPKKPVNNKTDDSDPNGDAKAKADADSDAGKSKYQKEQARQSKTWESINARKAELDNTAAMLDTREKALTEREAKLRTAPKPRWTPEQLRTGARQFEAKAIEAEQAGDYEAAERHRETAKIALQDAAEQERGNSFTSAAAWRELKADMPEVLDPGSAVNKAYREALASEPNLLRDEAGPYRAALMVHRKLLATANGDLVKAQADAKAVPELRKQVDALTKQLAELKSRTELSDSGGATLNRGRTGARPWNELTLEEQERHLDREFAQSL